MEVILEGGAGDQETVGGLELTDGQRQLALLVLDSKIKYKVRMFL